MSQDDAPLSDVTLRLQKRGAVTLPKAVRERYGLGEGDRLHLVDLGGVFVLAPDAPQVPALSRAIEQMRREAGVSTEELLDGLREERRRYYAERYHAAGSRASEDETAPSEDHPSDARA
jgi:AbrB family looped-hinge helix DNA binding protein